jgi:CubicO group peptidase (beta-lactamase class C family)
VGGEAAVATMLGDELFGAIGMTTAEAKFDLRGTFIGSTFVYATARDYGRFGELYRVGGLWAGRQILPSGWTDYAACDVPVDIGVSEPFGYGSHWWTYGRAGFPGAFAAHGYESQRIIVVPDRELVVVQLSKVASEHSELIDGPLRRIIAAYPKQ